MTLSIALVDGGVVAWLAVTCAVMFVLYTITRLKGNHEAGKALHWVGITQVFSSCAELIRFVLTRDTFGTHSRRPRPRG